MATTSEAGAVDRHAVVLRLVLSVADIITRKGAPGVTAARYNRRRRLYNDAGGVCCGASLRLAPPSCPSTPP